MKIFLLKPEKFEDLKVFESLTLNFFGFWQANSKLFNIWHWISNFASFKCWNLGKFLGLPYNFSSTWTSQNFLTTRHSSFEQIDLSSVSQNKSQNSKEAAAQKKRTDFFFLANFSFVLKSPRLSRALFIVMKWSRQAKEYKRQQVSSGSVLRES